MRSSLTRRFEEEHAVHGDVTNQKDDGKVYIMDKSSAHGTYLNGKVSK